MNDSSSHRLKKRPNAQDVIRKDSPDDYTGPSAKDRSLYINLGIIKYGTTDKLQGAALFISMLLLFLIFLAVVLGFYFDSSWAKEVISWLLEPFFLSMGVAVGRGSLKEDKDNSE